ncbi:MAG: TIGR02556 family CRISPR-associated protein [Candidatus Mcinerneyibacterium aminivorans]|uniref:TIGR02556 family CRISPR-associated protein n=1 Tax=Candidatus Mcinerneyibacterium aminivorans TaxID=2703815 RepID=A0A5D0MGD8_9BACT|nr:MAG: TIGR02556 family CRISPR-associated protein [Candidatus Mcinerneyibacterium aminivorans]
MIKALYNISKSTFVKSEGGHLDDWIDYIGENYDKVLKIVFEIDNNKINYKKVDIEDNDSSKRMKYLFRSVRGNAGLETPTTRITTINKSVNKKLKKSIKSFIKKNTKYLDDEDKNFLKKLDLVFQNEFERILKEMFDLLKRNDYLRNEEEKYDSALSINAAVTLTFKENYEEKYLGDMEVFKKTLDKKGAEVYKKYYSKYGKKSKNNNQYCYVCNNNDKEVWGFVDLKDYKFYTVDKPGLVTGGFDQKYAWKNYPVCPDCALELTKAKQFVDNNLEFKFCGLSYKLIPKLVFDDRELLDEVLQKLKRYKSFSLGTNSENIERVEEAILDKLKNFNNTVQFNFMFFRKNQSAFNILLYLKNILPSRLKKLIQAKNIVDRYETDFDYKYEVFKPIPYKKDKEINFDFQFRFIRDFFPYNDRYENKKNYDKQFLEILNKIFINRKISYNFLINRFMRRISFDYKNDNWFEVSVKKAYKILLYFNELKLLKRRYNVAEKNVKSGPFSDFFRENDMIDSNLKKALFLEGALTKKLLNIQYKKRNNKPFRNRLNGLRINEKVAKRLLPEIINKLEEYDSNYYQDLENAISFYFAKSNFDLTVDEMSFYFGMGLSMSNALVKKEEVVNE